MRALRPIVFSLLVIQPVFSRGQELDGDANVASEAEKPKILFAAQLVRNRLAEIDLTDEQQRRFDSIAEKLTREAMAVRAATGIDKDVMSRRDETHSALRERGIGFGHEEYWKALQREANLTDTQIVGFKDSRIAINEFQKGVASLLTEQQRKQYAKTRERRRANEATTLTVADQMGRLIFEDDFERSESQEVEDEVGNGWGTNSRTRAGGNKQVDLRDGAMYIYIHETADHGVSVTHPAEFTNGSVQMSFMLEDEKDTLGLNFADLQFKEVHAGHLFKVTVGVKYVEIADLKTGNMDLKTREARLAGKLTPAQKAELKTKSKKFPHKLETGTWYTVVATVTGDTLTVLIDGKEVGSFKSEGIAHPTKRMLRLAVHRNVVVDDVKIFAND